MAGNARKTTTRPTDAVPCTLADWVTKLDAFLEFNERNVLTHAGTISHDLAEEHAQREFDKYEAKRRHLEATTPTTDFDKAVDEVKRLEKKTPPLPDSKASARGKKKGGGE